MALWIKFHNIVFVKCLSPIIDSDLLQLHIISIFFIDNMELDFMENEFPELAYIRIEIENLEKEILKLKRLLQT